MFIHLNIIIDQLFMLFQEGKRTREEFFLIDKIIIYEYNEFMI